MSGGIFKYYDGRLMLMSEDHLRFLVETYVQILDRREEGVPLDRAALEAKLGRKLDNTRVVTLRDGIATIPVHDTIVRRGDFFSDVSGLVSLDTIAKDYTQAKENTMVKGVILDIGSPGGEMDGIEEFAEMIRRDVEDGFNVVAFVENMAASAGYWIAAACRKIYVGRTTLLGSIGVAAVIRPERAREGKIEIVSSQSPDKRVDPQTERGRALIQQLVDDSAEIFIETMARYRGKTVDYVKANFGGGWVKMGEAAIRAGMADGLDSYEDLLAEMAGRERRRPRQKVRLEASAGVVTSGCLKCGSDLLVQAGFCFTCRVPAVAIN